MIFTLTWNNNYGVAQKSSTYARATFESGGTLLNLYSPKIITDRGLERYQYLRASLDFRKNIALSKTRAFAFRINTGFGWIYSPNNVLPYEKNFFAGGSNSVRAWRPRRLGLGSDPPTAHTPDAIPGNGYFDYSFEKPGQLLLEGSMEWRQKLFGFVHGALFIDAGNVWAVGTSDKEKATFNWNSFYKQFGIGTGFGLRFDFTFLILRFDVGIKAWEPADDPDRPIGHFVLWNAKFWGPYSATREPVIYNIGIGYPF
jgi:outer membrane protein assembly factor BamA